MKAFQLLSFEPQLGLMEIPQPVPSDGEVLIKAHAAAINPADLLVTLNLLGTAEPELPAVLGMDVAGEIVALGSSVTQWKVGDRVYGCVGGVRGRQGTLAEYVVADARSLARKPESLTMLEAAALPLVSITAWDALIDRGKLQARETVLIQGGAGGVGHIAIQIAVAHGAKVYATASTEEKQEFVQALGATPIPYRDLDSSAIVEKYTQGIGFDVVFDCAGPSGLDTSFELVRTYGRVLTCSGWGSHDLGPLLGKSASLTGIFMLLPLLTGEGLDRHGAILQEVASLAERGRIRPVLDPYVADLLLAGEALKRQQSGVLVGKVVVEIAGVGL